MNLEMVNIYISKYIKIAFNINYNYSFIIFNICMCIYTKIKDVLASNINQEKSLTPEEQKDIMILKKKILILDHDIRKITRKLKSFQENEVKERQMLNEDNSNNKNSVQEIKRQILDLKRDIRRKEEHVELEQKKLIEVKKILIKD